MECFQSFVVAVIFLGVPLLLGYFIGCSYKHTWCLKQWTKAEEGRLRVERERDWLAEQLDDYAVDEYSEERYGDRSIRNCSKADWLRDAARAACEEDGE